MPKPDGAGCTYPATLEPSQCKAGLCVPPSIPSVYDLISQRDELTIFKTIVDAAGMQSVFTAAPVTVFAPVNTAFSGVTADELNAIVGSAARAQTIINGHYDATVYATNGVVGASGVRVLTADVGGANGYLNVIDTVLPVGASDVFDVIDGRGELRQLASVIRMLMLESTLKEAASLTVFAPTDAAFADFAARQGSGAADLNRVVLYHVVGGSLTARDLQTRAPTVLTTLDSGAVVTVAQGATASALLLDGVASIVTADIPALNGVVHIIDTVLLPENAIRPVSTPLPPFAAPLTPSPPVPPSDATQTTNTVASLLQTMADTAGFYQWLLSSGVAASIQPLAGRLTTVFAPTASAMAAVRTGDASVLQAHIVPGRRVDSMQLVAQSPLVTLAAGRSITAYAMNNVLWVEQARVVTRDIQAVDGVIHVIDAVLFAPTAPPLALTAQPFVATAVPSFVPPPTGPVPDPLVPLASGSTVWDIINGSPEYSMFAEVVAATGFDALLRNADVYTVFAPTNAAFIEKRLVPRDLIARDYTGLTRTVRYHIAPGLVIQSGQVPTVDTPHRLSFSGGASVSDSDETAAVVGRRVRASSGNGDVLGIDMFLEPPGVALPQTGTPMPARARVTFAPPPPPVTPSFTYAPGWPAGTPFPGVPTPPNPNPNPFFSIWDLIVSRVDLTQFALLLSSFGFAERLRDPAQQTTVIGIPNVMLQGTELLDLPQHQIEATLRHHLIPGAVLGSDALVAASPVETAQKDYLTFTRPSAFEIKVNSNARIIVRNLEASNGILHVVDAVIYPELNTPPSPSPTCSGNTLCAVLSQRAEVGVFYTLLRARGLTSLLDTVGPFTVLAPTDAAMRGWLPYLESLSADAVERILRYHILQGAAVESSRLATAGRATPTANGEFNAALDANNVITADIRAANGLVHITSSVLLPGGGSATSVPSVATPVPPPTQCRRTSVCGVLSVYSELSMFATALGDVGVLASLDQAGPFTVFAPSNAAFASLPAGVAAYIMSDAERTRQVLQHHIIATLGGASATGGTLTSGSGVTQGIANIDLPAASPLQPLYGPPLTARPGGTTTATLIGASAVVVNPDLAADNGVVHVVSSVIVPDTIALPSADLLEVLGGIPKFAAFTRLAAQAGVASLLQGPGPYTVLAVDNDLLAERLAQQPALAGDPDALAAVVRRHILVGYHSLADITRGGIFATTTTVSPSRDAVALQQAAGGDLTVAFDVNGRPAYPGISPMGPWFYPQLGAFAATNGVVHHAAFLLATPPVTRVPPQAPPPTASPVVFTLAPPTPTPPSTPCTVAAYCSGLADRAVLVGNGFCACECRTGYGGVRCETCAFGYSGYPNCRVADAATAQPITSAPTGSVTNAPEGGAFNSTPEDQEGDGKGGRAAGDGDDDGGLDWWWIVLIVGLLLCILCLAVVFCLWKANAKPAKKQVEDAIPDEKAAALLALGHEHGEAALSGAYEEQPLMGLGAQDVIGEPSITPPDIPVTPTEAKEVVFGGGEPAPPIPTLDGNDLPRDAGSIVNNFVMPAEYPEKPAPVESTPPPPVIPAAVSAPPASGSLYSGPRHPASPSRSRDGVGDDRSGYGGGGHPAYAYGTPSPAGSPDRYLVNTQPHSSAPVGVVASYVGGYPSFAGRGRGRGRVGDEMFSPTSLSSPARPGSVGSPSVYPPSSFMRNPNSPPHAGGISGGGAADADAGPPASIVSTAGPPPLIPNVTTSSVLTASPSQTIPLPETPPSAPKMPDARPVLARPGVQTPVASTMI